ncbi:Protein of unknown function DUF247, plant [Dillenia turbinata]|uniref:Uncharacterized protein n=1 Tax=Dillenia turbinata TaxID=194707 RepID=A0AAN8UIZ5_9MAGN
MEEMIRKLWPLVSPECCIYRVPETIALVNAKAYKPRLVSIGPFYHGLQKYQAMKEQKLHYLHAYLQRAKLSMAQCVEAVRILEGKARSSYAEPIKLSSYDFAKMLLVDACFIIELFLRSCLGEQENQDLVLKVPRLLYDLDHDLILLENQVPFFVLEEIYNLFHSISPSSFPTMLELTFAYFSGYNKLNRKPQPEFEIKHFTDLLRKFHIQLAPAPQFRRKRTENFKSLPRATELDVAGAMFETDSSPCWLDIWFVDNKKLKIPQLEIDDGLESLIRNLVAFEQCHCPKSEHYLGDYITFIKGLAKTPKDVDLLVRNGIIVNWLGDNEAVTNLLHSVCANIVTSTSMFYYSGLCEELIAYCKKPWNSYKATLKRDYFKTPWRTAATIAAVVLLLLTCMQTITSIMSIKK